MFLYQIKAKFTKSSHSVMRTLNSKSTSSHSEVFLEKMFWKYAANVKENTHAEVWFRQICKSVVNLTKPFVNCETDLLKFAQILQQKIVS